MDPIPVLNPSYGDSVRSQERPAPYSAIQCGPCRPLSGRAGGSTWADARGRERARTWGSGARRRGGNRWYRVVRDSWQVQWEVWKVSWQGLQLVRITVMAVLAGCGTCVGFFGTCRRHLQGAGGTTGGGGGRVAGFLDEAVKPNDTVKRFLSLFWQIAGPSAKSPDFFGVASVFPVVAP
ncbi:hypothetical protein C8J57DRAFT_1246941 [Mycena rebaudengoi]|nr:hypothetical protein C8J57DRAFT_1246941 [Mycena rebaudengoi]